MPLVADVADSATQGLDLARDRRIGSKPGQAASSKVDLHLDGLAVAPRNASGQHRATACSGSPAMNATVYSRSMGMPAETGLFGFHQAAMLSTLSC